MTNVLPSGDTSYVACGAELTMSPIGKSRFRAVTAGSGVVTIRAATRYGFSCLVSR
jgi:hypothetical protein